MKNKQRPANSTYKKLAVQWLNKILYFVSTSVVAESFELRNRQLLVAANRYRLVLINLKCKSGDQNPLCRCGKKGGETE
jgi:hypothetical protein